MINSFLEKNYDEIVKMTEKITQDVNYRDIAHYVIDKFIEHPRAEELIFKDEALRFLSGMIHRNYHSSTSPYHKLYRQKGRVYATTRFQTNKEEEDYDTHTDLRLDAIEGILEDMQAESQHHWFIASLFVMWIETPNFSELERRTKIPRTSISQAVNECREYVQKKLKEYGIT